MTAGAELEADLSVARHVVEAVASREGTDPTELAPLYESIEPDGLNSLFTSAQPGPDGDHLSVDFDYAGYRVTVERDESITVSLSEKPRVDRGVDGRVSTATSNAED
jgi:hypothetical protein